jgi:hypothetical protein
MQTIKPKISVPTPSASPEYSITVLQARGAKYLLREREDGSASVDAGRLGGGGQQGNTARPGLRNASRIVKPLKAALKLFHLVKETFVPARVAEITSIM